MKTVAKGTTAVKRLIRTIFCTIIFTCLTFIVIQTASAAETLVTNDAVNFRSSPSLDASVITSFGPGVSVEVLEHDPVGWSKVRVNGTTGYIKSDYLTIPSGVEYVTFITIDGVNFRSGPSLDASVLWGVGIDTPVAVFEHNPVGWSKVRIDGVMGYIKSEFLALPIQGSQQANSTSAQSRSHVTLKTVDGVNFRSGPSLDASIIRTIDTGTSVDVLERDPSGWSMVSFEGTIGYIKSDLLSVNGRVVELMNWSEVRKILKNGVPIYTIDVRTGRTFTIQCFSIGDHADVEPLTQADTDTMFDIRGGVWSWAARPIWVNIGDHLIAASIHGMPHDVSTIRDNGMNGHLCLHFLGSTTSSTSASYKADLQNAVMEAWNAATS